MSPGIGRRRLFRLAAGVPPLAVLGLTWPDPARADHGWHDIDMTGVSPPLQFTMTRATDGKVVTEKDYRGKIVLLYFGYTFCPDVCPLTLNNVARILHLLGKRADDVRLLFVTVDPNRDTLPVLKQYAAVFAPQVIGMRGTPDALIALTRRYRIAWSVTPAHDGKPYEVTHSSAIYVFDREGDARLLIPSLASQKADINGVADDLRKLIAGNHPPGTMSRILGFFRDLV
jgi:protein SCO1